MGARVILVGGFWDDMGRWEKAKWLVARIEKIVEVASGLSDGEARMLVNRYCRVKPL